MSETSTYRVASRVPEAYRSSVRIGACSWKFESWKGLYYETGKRYRADDFLPDYARHLDSVEIDQWFWSLFPGGLRLPEPDTVKRYAASVPDDFVFSIKAPNSLTLTHYYSKQPRQHVDFAGRPNIYFLDNDILNRFLDLLSPLGNKIGPIMFQFEYLNFSKMRSREVFLERLGEFVRKAPAGFDYAIETRNPGYLSRPLFRFLERNGLGFVYLEGYHMPPIGRVFEKFHPSVAKPAIVRLHGPDRAGMEKMTHKMWNRVVVPRPESIRAAARIARWNTARGGRTFINVNNHFEGSAPITIERFIEALEKED